MKSRLIVRVGSFLLLALFSTAHAQSPPSNDDFANRSLLQGSSFSFSGGTYGATEEANENLVSAFAEASVWWRWVAPSSGIATIQATAFDFGYSELGIFRGPAPFTNFQLSNNLARVDGYSGPYANFRVYAGVEYEFGLFGYRYSQTVSSFAVSMAPLSPAPVNDNFANRIILTGTSATFGGATLGATMETGEDTPSYSTDNDGSRWWSWTAPNDGFATLSFAEAPLVSVQTPFVRILRGPGLTTLSYVATLSPLSSESTVFRARSGETFSFQMRGKASTNIAINMKLELANLPEAPANDAFANRTVLQGASANFSGNLYGSGYESGETFPYAADTAFRSGSIWWSWTASNDGFADVVLPSTFTGESVFWIFKDAPTVSNLGSNLAQVTRLSPLTVSVRTQPGETFVFGASSRAHTNVTHQFALTTRSLAPANDLFANRIVLPPGSQEFIGNLAGSTTENGEPDLWMGFGDGSIWWSWTPSISGFAVITLPDARPLAPFEYNAELYVGRGAEIVAVAPLANRVAALDVGAGRYTGFPINAGETYTIGLFGDPSTNITYRFALTIGSTPIILEQPQNQSVKPGGAALFRVFAPATLPISIRWQFNGVELTNSSGPTLPVKNVSATNVGTYRAVVGTGSVMTVSAPATLSLNDVERQPLIRLLRSPGGGNDHSLLIEGEANQTYLVQGTGDFVHWGWLEFTPFGEMVKNLVPRQLRTERLGPVSTIFRAVRYGDLKDACIVNLRRIDMAKEAWKVWFRKAEGTAVTDSSSIDDINRFFGPISDFTALPRCPEGGTYTYNAIGTPPVCSLQAEGHTL